MTWTILFNIDNFDKIARGDTSYNRYQNTIMEDRLERDQTVTALNIYAPIYRPIDATGRPSTTQAGSILLTSKFTKIEQSVEDTDYELFKTKVMSSGVPSYGIYNNKDVVVNFGDVPGNGIQLADDHVSLREKLQTMNRGLSEDELDALVAAYGSGNLVGGQVVAYSVRIAANTQGGQGEYENTAKVSYTGIDPETVQAKVFVERLVAGVDAGEPGTVTLIKSDSKDDTLLAGAKFKIQKEVSNGVFEDYQPVDGGSVIRETDANGELQYKQLDAGTYRMVEVEAAERYDKDSVAYSQEVFQITTADSVGIIIYATNDVSKGNVELIKTDATNTDIKLKGAEFVLYRIQDDAIEYYQEEKDDSIIWNTDIEQAKRFVTDITGKFAINDLELGTYFFKEVKAPSKYMLSSKVLSFDINTANQVLSVEFNNEKIKGNVELVKIDATNEDIKLKGAEFVLYRIDDDKIEYYQEEKEDGIIWSVNIDQAKQFTTDATGKFVISNLEVDTYFFKEVKAPNGYILSLEVPSFDINTDNQESTIEFKNKKTMGIDPGGIPERNIATVTPKKRTVPKTGTFDNSTFFVIMLTFSTFYSVSFLRKKKMSN